MDDMRTPRHLFAGNADRTICRTVFVTESEQEDVVSEMLDEIGWPGFWAAYDARNEFEACRRDFNLYLEYRLADGKQQRVF